MVLPEEMLSDLAGVPDGDLAKWDGVPEAFLPKVLRKGRDAFWQAFRAGKDPRDFGAWGLDDATGSELMAFLGCDPTGARVLVSLPRTIDESMEEFYTALLREATRVLEEPNVRDDALQSKLVDAKARIFANVRHQVDAFLKLRDGHSGRPGKPGRGAPPKLVELEPGPDEEDPGEGEVPEDAEAAPPPE